MSENTEINKIATAICRLSDSMEAIEETLDTAFIEKYTNRDVNEQYKNRNVVDGLFAIAQAIEKVARSLDYQTEMTKKI